MNAIGMEGGQDRRTAALESGNSLSIPLLTSTLTTILAFLPIALAEGGTGEYTLSLGQVLMIVLLASWFLAMYMTPLMCFWFMKMKPREESRTSPYDGRFYRLYRGFLEGALRFRIVVLGLIAGFMALAGFAFQFVVKEFFPASDRNQFLVYIDMPAGTHVTETARVVEVLSA